MGRCLLILMLATTQLTAGSGLTIHLCISHDGQVRFDGGAGSCSRCHEHETLCGDLDQRPDADERCSSHCQHHTADVAQKVAEDESKDAESVGSEKCGCLHIPVVISNDSARSKSRISAAVEIDRLSGFPSPVIELLTNAVQTPGQSHGHDATLGLNYSLIAISTTMIRC